MPSEARITRISPSRQRERKSEWPEGWTCHSFSWQLEGLWSSHQSTGQVFDRTNTIFDREAMPWTNNYARSVYCQIERQGNYQATNWCMVHWCADHRAATLPFLKLWRSQFTLGRVTAQQTAKEYPEKTSLGLHAEFGTVSLIHTRITGHTAFLPLPPATGIDIATVFLHFLLEVKLLLGRMKQ